MLPRKVTDFDDTLIRLFKTETLGALLEGLRGFLDVDMQAALPRTVMRYLRDQMKKEQEVEIGPRLAAWYTRSFFQPVTARKPKTYEELCLNISRISKQSAMVLAPTMYSFADFVFQASIKSGIRRICIMARDATPFLPVFLRLQRERRTYRTIDVRTLQAVRSLFGIRDEIAKRGALEFDPKDLRPAIKKKLYSRLYARHILKPLTLRSGFVACVDVGYYGTVVRSLYNDQRLKEKPSVFFFASANPFVFGYLNTLIQCRRLESGDSIDSDFIWVLGDTIEAIPKPYGKYVATPNVGLTDCELVVRPTTLFPSLFAIFHCWHLYHDGLHKVRSLTPKAELMKVYDLRRGSKGGSGSSFILPVPQPEWRGAQGFLRRWGCRSIPPQIQFLETKT